MRGVVLAAYMNGNPTVPYADLAVLAASLIQRQIGPIPITLFTDSTARDMLVPHAYRFDRLFREIIADDRPQEPNLRQFPGTNQQPIQFNNRTRSSLYGRVDYDEMLLLDTDFLLYEDSLKQVWDSSHPIRINRYTTSIRYPNSPMLSRIGDLTIPLYWATAAYFRRSTEVDRFFRLVEYVTENYEWFGHVYRYDHRLFRNDYTFSIAVHLLGGQIGGSTSVSDLPDHVLRFAWDDDRVVDFNPRGLWFNAQNHQRKFDLIPVMDQSVHVLNKPSLGQFVSRMIEQEWEPYR
jgi:hypothetical protein